MKINLKFRVAIQLKDPRKAFMRINTETESGESVPFYWQQKNHIPPLYGGKK